MKKIVKNLFDLTCRKFVVNQRQPLRSVEGTVRKQVRSFVSSSGTNISGSPGSCDQNAVSRNFTLT